MGKPTGFMDYKRQDKIAETPLERIQHFNEFHTPLSKEEQELQGSTLYGVRSSILSVRKITGRDGKRMSAPQFSTGME